MGEVRVSTVMRRAGNSLAVLIPADQAREGGLVAGSPVEVLVRTEVPRALGLLTGTPYAPFDRRKEGLWRDRI